MSTELFYLTLTGVLAASLWIPFIVGTGLSVADPGPDFIRPPDLRALPAWVHRAHRAHLNLIEQATPFAALVLIAHAAQVSTVVTVWATAIFFWLRVAHAAGMISGVFRFPLRPIVFTAGWLCTLALAWEVLTAG
ncbi:MAG: MAPEG family protein [Pseudomonadota bacterium]